MSTIASPSPKLPIQPLSLPGKGGYSVPTPPVVPTPGVGRGREGLLAGLNTGRPNAGGADFGVVHKGRASQTMSHKAGDDSASIEPWMKAFGPHAAAAAKAVARMDEGFDAKDRPKRGVMTPITVNGIPRGLLCGHPETREQAFAELIGTAKNGSGVINLAGHEAEKYGFPLVPSRFPAGKPQCSANGAFEITRLNSAPRRVENLGPNASGKTMDAEIFTYRVRHMASGKSRDVPVADVMNYEDTSTPPGDSLRKIHEMGESLGVQHPERMTHRCGAGIGRSATQKEVAIASQESDRRKATNEEMSVPDMMTFTADVTRQIRQQRGHAVMPDPYQQMAVLLFGMDEVEKRAKEAQEAKHKEKPQALPPRAAPVIPHNPAALVHPALRALAVRG
ncbi:MAG: hypothetical protein EOP39_21015 [Rubrivivax sp.]|nr:MAG: hypothetical protein EOP39_21015 [Rubrivivax sp.]